MKNPIPISDICEYEKQSFEQRVKQGLLMDRSPLNLFHGISRMGFGDNAEKIEGVKDMGFRMLYQNNRQDPGYRRSINAKLVNSTKIHDQIINLTKPVLLDIFRKSFPTDRDWKKLSEIPGKDKPSHEKTIRRRKKQFPELINPLPKIRNNQNEKDSRLNSFVTSYTQLPLGNPKFDVRNYVDCNYFIRLERFWKDTLEVLREIMEKFGLEKEITWFVYHIVNNDVGLHVLFDNLSLECELRWFKTLKTGELTNLSLPLYGMDPNPFTIEDAKKGISELRSFIHEFDKLEIPSSLCFYKISQKTMRKRMYEIALHAADGYHCQGNFQQYELIMQEIDRIF